jgi:hypothetical protein
MANADFVNQVYQTALALGIPEVQARLAATQAALETGFGKSAPGNNYFGIKGPGQTQPTTEAQNGALQAVDASFRTYPDLPGSIQGWWNTIQQDWPQAATAADFPTAIDALNNGRYGSYATDKVERNDPLTYQDKLAAINQNYLGGAPIPSKNVPNATPLRAAFSMAGPATGYIPFAPPAPLTPQSMQSGSPLDKLPQTAMYGLQQRLTPGQVTAPPTDFTTQDTGAPATDLMRFATPPVLPQAAKIAGGALPSIGQLGLPFASSVGAAIPPVPAPAPSFMRPQLPPAQVQQASYSPAPSTPNLVRLPSGKMVAPGVYPSQSNPGSMVTVSDDGSGNAIIKETNLGLMNPAKMGQNTVAGGYIGQQLAPAVSSAVNNTKEAIAPQVTGLASNITNGAQALGGQIGGMFSNMFGGGTPAAPSVPAPPPVYTPPTTRYTMQQMQVSNPAYLKYIAGQNADPILGGPGSFASLQAMNQPPAPPKFITVTRQIPLPALPVMAAPVLAPPSPPPVPAQPPGASFLAARGVDTSNMSAGQQANALAAMLSGNSQRGSFGV